MDFSPVPAGVMDVGLSSVLESREKCTYTKCYCEENVWKLCDLVKRKVPQLLGSCCAVFISNDQRAVPIWEQKACLEPQKYVIWDYHVILLYADDSACLIYDMDTKLDFPCDIQTYFTKAIGSEGQLAQPFHRKFRVVSATDYLAHFASDRSHMLREDGSWMAQPPNYPPIQTQESSNNIDDFINMECGSGWGDVLSLPELLQKFSPDLRTLPSLL